MYIYPVSAAISGMYSVGGQERLASTYPDLEKQDLALVEDYLDAYGKKGIQPERYHNFKTKVIKKMLHLQLELEWGKNEQDQLKILAKLVNFNQIMRKTYVAPISFSLRFYVPEYLRRSGGKGLPANIPDEVKTALNVKFKEELSFSDYVARHVQRAFFVKRLGQHVRILGSENWIGTSDEATQSVVVDTYDDKNSESFGRWLMAAALVHEAAHIDYFYRFRNKPIMQELNRAERYAYIVTRDYLVKIGKDKSISEETRKKIERACKSINRKITGLNQKLDLASDDFNIKR